MAVADHDRRIERLLLIDAIGPRIPARRPRRRAHFTAMPGAGHLPMREAPEATFAVIDAFLIDTP